MRIFHLWSVFCIRLTSNCAAFTLLHLRFAATANIASAFFGRVGKENAPAVEDGSIGVGGQGGGGVDGEGEGTPCARDVWLCQHCPLRKLDLLLV